METISQWVTQYGYAAIFVLQALSIIGVPFPDETTLVFFGYLVFRQNLNLVFAIAAATAGSMCGITISYSLGRSMGFYALRKLMRLLRVSAEALEKTRAHYKRFGPWLLFFGYFIPGVRHLNAMVSGTMLLGFGRFAMFAWTGALIWVSVFVSAGYVLGERWTQLGEQWALLFERIEWRFMVIVLTVLAVLVVLGLFWFFKRSKRKQ
jgi:membrane protein DedA with SNARE-associated domain